MTHPPLPLILQFSSSSGPGGAERVISKLAASIRGNGVYGCTVGLFRPGWLEKQCEANGVSTRIVGNRSAVDPRWIKTLLDLIRGDRVALIHAHEFDAIVHGTIAARLAGIPIVATIHGKNYYAEKTRRRLAYRWVSAYAKMVTVSEDLKGFVRDSVGVKEGRLTVVYNGVEQLPLIDASETESCKSELGIPTGGQVLGVVGSLYPVKGHRYLLDALPAVLRLFPHITVLLIGRGELDVELREQAKRLGIERSVRFLGLREDIPRLLSVLDIFILPSLSEGLSMSILEAMAMGKPVVATAVGGNAELVVSGQTGLLVPKQKSEALAAGILSLLKDAKLAASFGENGRKRVRSKFTLDTMVKKYHGLYAASLNC